MLPLLAGRFLAPCSTLSGRAGLNELESEGPEDQSLRVLFGKNNLVGAGSRLVR